MKFRDIIFWTHLVAGLVTGAFVLIMSVTGVLLTYERQMIRWAENAAVEAPSPDSVPMGADELVLAARAAGARDGHVITLPRNPSDAVEVSAGRRNSFLLNPYTGEVMEEAGAGTQAFFSRLMRIHRWLAFTGSRSELGATLNGASNLVFALLILTGLYLWLPKLWKWSFIKLNLLFRRQYPTTKAKHYNWHHVAGFWFALPLLAIVLTGAVFSYSWANRLVYAAFGEEPGRRGPATVSDAAAPAETAAPLAAPASLETLIAQAVAHDGPGRRIAITLPAPTDTELEMRVDFGNGAQADRITTLVLARDGSGVTAVNPGEPASQASQARRFIRFLHTGEVYGFWGQTIAGLASLFAILLVYTGACLGVSRLNRMIRQRAGRRAAG
ncbi:PepSY-associated TM helix domain-containing protein [Maricaulis parjimensis]|uniref:PepSY-associated TM helix domain-containing protein n=1 Tax=Maricaulis parjimensis TaxID=144023 RepID=UPI00193939DF|nr:PepSY-associated TM helix domain-containing protein [Maricaulis parjimensis]